MGVDVLSITVSFERKEVTGHIFHRFSIKEAGITFEKLT